tara:strand:+ start:2405 stop:3004 length:600 start_codon:yes stop_codon:yes gene_type:complete
MSKHFVVLYIELLDSIKTDPSLSLVYKEKVTSHNNSLNNLYADSGFDLHVPNVTNLQFSEKDEIALIKHGIKCACYKFDNGIRRWTGEDNLPNYEEITKKNWIRDAREYITPQPFCLYPRSSIWKNGVTLANSVGIIDSGYRGEIMAALKNFREKNEVKYANRYVQICMPDLMPFYVCIVDKLDIDSDRGEGGFGSTGK